MKMTKMTMKTTLSSMLKRMLLVAALPLLAGAGCDTYSYINIDVSLSTTSTVPFTRTSAFAIQQCHMVVSGAITDSFDLDSSVCPPPQTTTSNPFEIGTIDYSTFADSGNVTFTLNVFDSVGEKPECQVGTGSTTVAIVSGKVASGVLSVAGSSTPPAASCQ
jgi:hypothetical protein